MEKRSNQDCAFVGQVGNKSNHCEGRLIYAEAAEPPKKLRDMQVQQPNKRSSTATQEDNKDKFDELRTVCWTFSQQLGYLCCV